MPNNVLPSRPRCRHWPEFVDGFHPRGKHHSPPRGRHQHFQLDFNLARSSGVRDAEKTFCLGFGGEKSAALEIVVLVGDTPAGA